MFDLRDFILKILNGMIGVEPDYKVREFALGWYAKSILVKADLGAIDALIEERNRIKNENTAENTAESAEQDTEIDTEIKEQEETPLILE